MLHEGNKQLEVLKSRGHMTSPNVSYSLRSNVTSTFYFNLQTLIIESWVFGKNHTNEELIESTSQGKDGLDTNL